MIEHLSGGWVGHKVTVTNGDLRVRTVINLTNILVVYAIR